MLGIVGIGRIRKGGEYGVNKEGEDVLRPVLAAALLPCSKHTFNCDPVNGASGAQSFKTSTKQQAAKALTPLSLWLKRFWPASSFATLVSESLSTSSWSISRSSFDRASSLFSSSPVAMGFPARHDSGSLKTRLTPCGSWATLSAWRRAISNGDLQSQGVLGRGR